MLCTKLQAWYSSGACASPAVMGSTRPTPAVCEPCSCRLQRDRPLRGPPQPQPPTSILPAGYPLRGTLYFPFHSSSPPHPTSPAPTISMWVSSNSFSLENRKHFPWPQVSPGYSLRRQTSGGKCHTRSLWPTPVPSALRWPLNLHTQPRSHLGLLPSEAALAGPRGPACALPVPPLSGLSNAHSFFR